MVKLSRAVRMGQTPSQADAFEPEELGANSKKRKGRKDRKDGKKKARRRSKSSKESANLEEESARVLLQLREDARNSARVTPPDEMFAASAQLWAESPPASPPTSNAVKNDMAEVPEISGFPQHNEQIRKKKKKKRNRHEFEASQHEVDNSEVAKDDNTERPSKQARCHSSTSKPKDRLILTQSTFSLDDISTDDETIATYLQEYEKNFTSPTSPKSTQMTQIAAVESSESRIKRPAVIHYRDGSDSPVQPVYQLPWRSDTSSSRPEKEKSKRKTQSDRVPETSDGVQEQVDGPGPHAFAIHHEAFDDEFEPNQYDSASLSEDPAEYDPPIDPELIQDRSIQAPADDAMERPNKDVGPQPSNEAKSKRVSSPSRKRKEEKKPRSVNPSDLPYTRPEDLSGSQEDAVLPEIEDSLRELRQDSTAELERSAPPTTSRHREKTPSPLAKAYNVHGNRTQENGQRGKHYDSPLQQIAQNGGIFSESEILKLDAFRDSYCRQNDLTQWQFNSLVQSELRKNPSAMDLWDEAHQITPYRTKTSTKRFCRRRYHNFSVRGTWTQSEDESLKQAVAEKGKSWKAVGEMIERFPEDCRDRYRNYHVNSEHRNRDEWTEAEVRNLCNAVYSCMQMMKEERKRAREEIHRRGVPEPEPELDPEIQEMKLINWQAVSDRMGPDGGGRSRLQCSFKWGKLKMADRNNYLKEVKAAKRAKLPGKSRKAKRSWRIRRALKKLRNMKIGDRYDFLEALSTCGVVEEENIPYRLLGNEAFRSRWTTVERKAALQKFKDEVPGAAKMEYREVVNRLLTRLIAEHSDKLEERWDPEKDGDVNLAKTGPRLMENERKEKVKLRREERKRKLKSAEFVHSADEEDPVKSTNNPAGVVVKEKNGEEEQSVAGSSAAATDDADEDSSGGNAGTETHGSDGSEVEDSDDSLFAGSSPPQM